jgi:hypothetical protein
VKGLERKSTRYIQLPLDKLYDFLFGQVRAFLCARGDGGRDGVVAQLVEFA